MNLKQKIVLITGASRGIGAEMARQFGTAGSIVVINYLNNEHLAGKVVREIEEMGGQSVAIRADVTDR